MVAQVTIDWMYSVFLLVKFVLMKGYRLQKHFYNNKFNLPAYSWQEI